MSKSHQLHVTLKRTAAIVLLGTSCISTPDYYELTPSYGNSNFDNRKTDFDTAGLAFTVGWAPSVTTHNTEVQRHNTRMEALAMADLSYSSHIPLTTLQDSLESADSSESLELTHIGIPEVPKTEQEANMMLIWVVGAMAIALMGLLAFTIKNRTNGK